jgi:hypothetical protein
MSLDSHLIHTCTIENGTGGNLNPYNNAKKEYGVPLEGVRCRLVESQEHVWNDQRQESTIQTIYKLILPPNIQIQERARISQVTTEDGTILVDLFRVKAMLPRRARSTRHLTATLERIS